MTRSQLPAYFNEWIDRSPSIPIVTSFVSAGNGATPGLVDLKIPGPRSVIATFSPADGWSIDLPCEGSLVVHIHPHPPYQCKIKPGKSTASYDLEFLWSYKDLGKNWAKIFWKLHICGALILFLSKICSTIPPCIFNFWLIGMTANLFPPIWSLIVSMNKAALRYVNIKRF